jgi:ABC-2 type transport system ATP-binding protein
MEAREMQSNAIEIDRLTVEFRSARGPVRAVDGLSLSIAPGTVFGFLGSNGAGKTTAMHVLLGFIKATSGTARMFGEEVGSSRARSRTGYLAEHPDTYRFLTGNELLFFTAQLFSLGRRESRRRIAEVLDWVGLDEAAAARRIQTYSRGMMQKICLAQALVNNPEVLLLDEPTGGLDPIARLNFRDIIRRLREAGKTVFLSSHELSEVEMVCDTVGILAAGRLVAMGAPVSLVGPGESLEQYFVRMVSAGRCVC